MASVRSAAGAAQEAGRPAWLTALVSGQARPSDAFQEREPSSARAAARGQVPRSAAWEPLAQHAAALPPGAAVARDGEWVQPPAEPDAAAGPRQAVRAEASGGAAVLRPEEAAQAGQAAAVPRPEEAVRTGGAVAAPRLAAPDVERVRRAVHPWVLPSGLPSASTFPREALRRPQARLAPPRAARFARATARPSIALPSARWSQAARDEGLSWWRESPECSWQLPSDQEQALGRIVAACKGQLVYIPTTQRCEAFLFIGYSAVVVNRTYMVRCDKSAVPGLRSGP